MTETGHMARGRFCRIIGQVLLFLGIVLGQSAFAVDVMPGRHTIWQGNVGVPGGIPTNRTIYTTIPAGASSATIQAALNACPSNQVVQLSAGTYNLSTMLTISRNGVTLRGAGTDKTIINCSDANIVLIGSTAWWNEWATPVASRHKDWTAGYAQGTTVITVPDTGDLKVGQLCILDQLNDPDTNPIGNDSHASYTDCYTSVAHPQLGYDRLQHQINRVVAINGSQVTLSEPVYMPNWSATYSPQIWWESTFSPTCFSGVEDFTAVGSGAGGGICMQITYACWARNVNVSKCADHDGYFWPLLSVRPEVRHCFLNGPMNAADNYGISTRQVSGMLAEDNIAIGSMSPLMIVACQGSVFAYNYMTNLQRQTGYMVAGLITHGGDPCMNLFEGNWAPCFGMDNVWGPAGYNTAFRNRFVGASDSPYAANGNAEAIQIMATNRHMNVIGNVLGTPGVNTYYEDVGGGSCHDGKRVYYIGPWNQGSGCSGPYDPLAYSTLFRACNWDSATTTNGGLVLGGYQPQDLPQSYFLASKPAYFGNLQWPPISPDNPNYSMSRTNIPAGYRFIFGVDPPAGAPNLAPVISSMTASTNSVVTRTVHTNQPVSFACSAQDPEGVSLTYSWAFGDGSTSSQSTATHSYSTSGTYNVRIDVSDGFSTTSSNLVINVTLVGVNLSPTAVINNNVSGGLVPLTVQFSGTGSSDPEGTALTYSWNFGDGSSSSSATPSKTYNTSGAYTATLTVSDGTNSNSASVIISVGAGANGLVAAYGFEEGSGSVANDSSGNKNHASFSGAWWAANGKFGKGVAFSSGSLLTVTDSASLHLSTGMTLEAWVYPTNVSAGWRNLIFKPLGNPNTAGLSYVLHGTTPGSVPSVYTSVSSSNLMARSTLPLNTWTHLAATYDGSTLKFYVNGVLISSEPQTGSIANSTEALTIGGNLYSGQNWSGLLDEIRIYNRALSSAELLTDRSVPIIGTTPVPRPAAPSGLRVAGP